MSDTKGVFAKRHDPQPDDETRPAAIQPHACVIAVAEDWTIRAASGNCGEVLGCAADDLLGKTLGGVFGQESAHMLRALVQALTTTDPVGHAVGCAVSDDDAAMDVTATRIGTDVFLEFEPATPGSDLSREPEQVRRLVSRIASRTGLAAAAQEAAKVLVTVTGFDRVSVHRIGKSGLDAPLGLSTGHPLTGPPGRALLQAISDEFHPHLHLISDVTAAGEGSMLHAIAAPLRADGRGPGNICPGPELAQALRRDKVRASMSIPVRIGGGLWGVILCHHGAVRTPSVAERGALAHFAHLFGYEIERMEHRLGAEARARAARLRAALSGGVEEGADLASALRATAQDLTALLPHDGWTLWHEGRFDSSGHAPTRDDFEGLFAILHDRAERNALAVDRLADLSFFPRSLDATNTALMVLPLARKAHECLILFRRLESGHEPDRSWESWDREAAAALRAALIEVQHKLIETARDARARAQERQGLLIADLNHRMRNTLNQILGFVSQGPNESASVEEFARVLESRIVVLARANDDLTEQDWGRVGLRVLLDRELGPFLTGTGPLVRMSGDRIDLSPTAFSTMALVLHELVSNARKYGALSVRSGRVDVATTLDENGVAHLVWTESGGPPARRPARTGYGLTLIEKSVPYELHGTAEVDFTPTGLVARFALPPGQFTRIRPDAERDALADAGPDGVPDDISIDGAALILDDSLIIAIESEELLRAAGASNVYSCNTVDAALQALDRGDVTFALLDVNLGSETSLSVAEQVWSDGIPAVLATGYGANEALLSEFPPLPVLSKPYTVAEIKDVLRHFRDRHPGG